MRIKRSPNNINVLNIQVCYLNVLPLTRVERVENIRIDPEVLVVGGDFPRIQPEFRTLKQKSSINQTHNEESFRRPKRISRNVY